MTDEDEMLMAAHRNGRVLVAVFEDGRCVGYKPADKVTSRWATCPFRLVEAEPVRSERASGIVRVAGATEEDAAHA